MEGALGAQNGGDKRRREKRSASRPDYWIINKTSYAWEAVRL